MHITSSAICPSARDAQIAVLHLEHARELERRVTARARAGPHAIEDACSFAWLQLLTHTTVAVEHEPARVLGWLTRTATREAWRLERARRCDGRLEHVAFDELCGREHEAPGPDEICARHERIALVAQIPERPRRFLLRLALGYSYREISAHETVSMTTTNRQIARAKRLLRRVEVRSDAQAGAARAASPIT